jgi:hypothetical protein
MSPTTWTLIELASEKKPLSDSVWRAIPANSERPLAKLVDSAAEAKILSQMLKELSPQSEVGDSDYDDVIVKPFRYGRNSNHESRFRAKNDEGLLYCAFDIETALREQSWWRVQFILASDGLKNPKGMALQVFEIKVHGNHIDLTAEPFIAYSKLWTHKSNYEQTQLLAKSARTHAIDAIKYSSVRNMPHGHCLAVLSLKSISTKKPLFLDANWWLNVEGVKATVIQDPLIGTGDSYSFDFEF